MKIKLLIAIAALAALPAHAAPFNIWSTFLGTPGTTVPCDGSPRNAVASYNALPKSFGWKFDPMCSTHTASAPLNPEWCVEFSGNHLHIDRGFGSVNVYGDATEKFRFAVYHPTAAGAWPTGSYPVTLTGFVYIQLP